MSDPIRVLVVDDSPFTLHVLTKHLEADPGITVVDQARNGLEALDKIKVLKPDVVTLDVEMPRMDGLTALQHIMTESPTPVVMLSALTQRGARVTIQALMRGAVDFVLKPSGADTQNIIAELIAKIKVAAGTPPSPALAPKRSKRRPSRLGPRPFRKGDPLIIIGASTGGPRALHRIFSELPDDLPAAIAMVQHMPAGFTRVLSKRLNNNSALTVQEAAGGDQLAMGLALLAPGGFHLKFEGHKQAVLDEGPRRNHLRPAVDVTMESAVAIHGPNVIGVVLTGMGVDGTDGARQIKAAGGTVVAEHESTSVVYGMPRSVVEAGLADQVVPLTEMASTLAKLVT